MNQGDIPSYIRAKTAIGLRLLMVQTNTKFGITFFYYQINFVNGYWYAWFNAPLNRDDELLNEK